MEKGISVTSNSGLIPLSNCYYLFYSPQNAHTFCLGFKTDFLRGCELPFCTLSSSGENGGPHPQFQVPYCGQLTFSILRLQRLVEEGVCNLN